MDSKFSVPVVERSGSSSATSGDSSSRSRTSSLDIGGSMVLYSAIKNVRKGRNDFENLFEEIRSTANLEVINYTRYIGTNERDCMIHSNQILNFSFFQQRNNSKLLPTNDNEYILPPFDSFVTKNSAKMTGNTSNRWIGTILERNTSSGSSS